MTSLPESRPGQKKLGLVIDLDTCVGCHACATACKEWNASGHMAPLTDFDPYGAEPDGVWFNRVHSFEAGDGAAGRTVHFPKACLHCETPACVTVCPTGASYKRAEDGIVLVNEDLCIGCKLCSWACPYGARDFGDLGDPDSNVSKLVRERGGYDLMPELGYRPTNKHLPPRSKPVVPQDDRVAGRDGTGPAGLLRWVDRIL